MNIDNNLYQSWQVNQVVGSAVLKNVLANQANNAQKLLQSLEVISDPTLGQYLDILF